LKMPTIAPMLFVSSCFAFLVFCFRGVAVSV
jgi:hypothetical protein